MLKSSQQLLEVASDEMLVIWCNRSFGKFIEKPPLLYIDCFGIEKEAFKFTKYG